MKDTILEEIRRIAEAQGGKPPGRVLFERETGIRRSQWYGKHRAKWSDALAEAGFAANELQGKADRDTLLDEFAVLCRSLGKAPTEGEWLLHASEHPVANVNTLRSHFGSLRGAAEALRQRAQDRGEDDLVEVLPIATQEPRHVGNGDTFTAQDGWVYLLQSGAHYKIGRSDELEKRIKQITVALPEKVELVHAIMTDDPSGIEAYWHRRFSDQRANGEWFKLTPGDVRAFKRRKFQ